MKNSSSADAADLVGLQTQAPNGLAHAGVDAQRDVGRLLRAVHGLQEAMCELAGLCHLRKIETRLRPYQFELLARLLNPRRAGLRADAQPVDTEGRGHRAIGFDRDAKAARMQRIDQGGVDLE